MADRNEVSQSTAATTLLPSKVDPTSAKFEANMRFMADLVSQVRNEEEKIREGGGAKAIEAQHAKKRLTARERIALLARSRNRFFELGSFAALGMYEEWGGAPAAGVVTGLGRVAGRVCMIIANDATVKAGAFFPMTAKKVIRAQTIAMENRIPTIYLVDSAGVFLPLQEDVFPDTDDFGRIFRNNAVMSAMGIPQITAIMGMCVAGGAYLPVMTDHVLMTEGSGLFLAGPALVQAAIGQKYSAEELGGATCTRRSPAPSTSKSRTTISASRACARWSRRSAIAAAPFGDRNKPDRRRSEICRRRSLLPLRSRLRQRPYDMHELIARIVDRSDSTNTSPTMAGPCSADTRASAASPSASSPTRSSTQPQTSHTGEKRIEFGGVIYAESAEKAARFIMDCNQNLIPLIFLHDVNGFMVGRDAEWSGIIRAGAKMVTAVSNSTVPKITVIVGGSFGAGNYAMCGKAYDPRFIFAWPTARYAVMSGASAADTLVEIKIKQLERGGKKLSDEEKQELLASDQEDLRRADRLPLRRRAPVGRRIIDPAKPAKLS